MTTTTIPTSQIEPKLSGFADRDLASAYAACRAITKRHARNFYYGLHLIPEPRRSAIFSIYAWMRAADDHVDAIDDPSAKAARLGFHQEMTEQVLKGGTPDRDRDAYWVAFAATLNSYPVPHRAIRDMILGLEEDINHDGYEATKQVDRYCYRVAGTVGLVCCAIWGLRPEADPDVVNKLAVERGLAFQRTNILRDFAQDFDLSPSRLYIARDVFEKHGMSPEDLRAWKDQRECWLLVSELARRARKAYDKSATLEHMIDPDCAPAMYSMTRIYAGLLEIIEKDPQRVVGSKRIRLSSRRKASIAFGARLSGKKKFA